MAVCAVCGTAFAAKQRGRPRAYCSRACQARAYRARQDTPGRSDAEVRRLAAFHAALAVESALANGWETLDRYGDDRPRVEAALNELLEELQRRGRSPQTRRRSQGTRAREQVAVAESPEPQGEVVPLPVPVSASEPAPIIAPADPVDPPADPPADDLPADLLEAARLVVAEQKASTTLLQDRMRISFRAAERLVDQLHRCGVVGPARGRRHRVVLVPADEPDRAVALLREGQASAEQAPDPTGRDENLGRDEKRTEPTAVAPEPPVPASASAPDAPPVPELPVVAPTSQAPPETEAVSVQVRLENLVRDIYLVVVDGARIGWIERASQEERGWRVHAADGRAVAVTDGFGLHQAGRAAARALLGTGVALEDCGLGNVSDHRDRTLELGAGSLARWELWRGRVSGRTDVMVRHRCLGWLQKTTGGRVVACTVDGPVPGSASRDRAQAVKALFAAWWAPVPLPELGEEFFAPRRVKARPGKTKPLCPYTEGQLAAAATNPPRLEDGGYQVIIRDRWDRDHDVELGQVRKHRGRRTLWVAYTPDGRSVASGKTRTEAIEAMLAAPGPLFGDPTETLLHDLADHDLNESVTKTPPVTKTGAAEHDDELHDGLEVPGRCPATARHEWMEFACLRRDGHPGAHRAITPTRHKSPVRWEEGGSVTDLQGRPLLRGTLPPTPPTSRRRTAR